MMNKSRSMIRTIVALVVTLTMVLTATLSVAAATPTTSGSYYKGYKIQKKTLKYCDSWDKTDRSLNYYYSDGMFVSGSSVYDSHLSSMALALSMSFMQEKEAGVSAVTSALTNLGCTSVYVRDHEDSISEDDMGKTGVAMGKKKIMSGVTLIPVIVRGANYGDEWAQNFYIGENVGGDADGYSIAADDVANEVYNYIENQGLTNTSKVKILLTGYSRGGAIATLAAAKLNNIYGAAKVYNYSYEPPQTSITTKVANSFAVSNKYDIVTKMLPDYSAIGMTGSDMNFKCASKNIKSFATATETAMKKQLRVVNSKHYAEFVSPSKFKMKKLDVMGFGSALGNGLEGIDINAFVENVADYVKEKGLDKQYPKNQSEFINLILKRMYAIIPNIDAYKSVPSLAKGYDSNACTCEEALKTVIGIAKSVELTETLNIESLDFSKLPMSAVETICNMYNDNGEIEQSDFNSFVSALKEGILGVTGMNSFAEFFGGNEEYAKRFEACFSTFADVLCQYIGEEFKTRDSRLLENSVITALLNIEGLVQAHYPEVNLSWIRSKDCFYTSAKAPCTTLKATKLKTLKAGKKSLTVNWAKQTVGTTGYQIQYGLKSSMAGAKIKTVAGKAAVKSTIKSLKAKKRYYVRIRTYTKMGDYAFIYSAWSAKKSLKTK